MKISTLSIGDELLCGQLTDTNAGTIAAALLAEGLRIQRHLTVGDSDPDIIEALNDLNRVSDAIIVTGGLGPTADDLTSRAAARATRRSSRRARPRRPAPAVWWRCRRRTAR